MDIQVFEGWDGNCRPGSPAKASGRRGHRGRLPDLIGDVAAFGVIAGATYLASQAVERFWKDIPSVVFFYPAFLLLVPGTVGLVSLASTDPGAIATALGTFISLCVGIKVGELLAGLRIRA